MKKVISLFAIAIFIYSCGEPSTAEAGNTAAASNESKKESSEVGVGQTLKTEYFDVTVNSMKVSDRVSTGNEFADLKKEDGNRYVIIDLTLKNTDSESRMMFDGELHIDENGKDLSYENAEMVMADGWGIIMDNINPRVTKKTKVVYKIPSDLKGKAYYHSGRGDGRIYIGDI